MNKLYLGTTNKAKVSAVEEVLPNYQIIACKVNSNVSNQPFSDEETIQGALNRAMSLPKDGLRLGLEAGVTFHNDIMYLINWGVLIDEKDNVYYAGGTRIPLPEFVKERLKTRTVELAEVMEEYTKINDVRSHQGAIGVLTNNQVTRKEIFTHIVKLLYGQYLYKE